MSFHFQKNNFRWAASRRSSVTTWRQLSTRSPSWNMSRQSIASKLFSPIIIRASGNDGVYQANHPVHIIDADGNLSPSAFIPFCAWAGNMEVICSLKDLF